MSLTTFLHDKLVNLVSGLGTDRDKASQSSYTSPMLSDVQIENAYRGSWLPRKIIDIPAQDATRKWRAWQADGPQIEKIEAEEKRLKVRTKVRAAIIQARLRGGSAIFIGTGDSDPSQPLDPKTVKAGGVKYLTVLTRLELQAGEIERDVLSAEYGRPRDYKISSSTGAGQLTIHPSRLVIFHGAEVPDGIVTVGNCAGWGDPALLSIYESIRNVDDTMANMAALVFEAKVDVFKVPGLMGKLQNDKKGEFTKALLARFGLAAQMKGINAALLMDAEEQYESKGASFGGLPDIADRFLQAASGAADIPATRLLGMSPAGMNASGESDLRNYYDRVQSDQELRMTPAMEELDECLIRSALGARPEEIYYSWKPLWQLSAEQKATRDKTIAETLKLLKDSRMFPDEALSRAAVNTLVENDIVPGLEAAIEDYGDELPDEEADIRAEEQAKAAIQLAKATGQPKAAGDPAARPAARPATRTAVKDGQPRPLYVSRDVLNGAEILAWARSQGFKSTLAASDLHVTIAYSRQPLDWMKVGDDYGPDDGRLTIAAGGPREVEQFGGGAVVLAFSSWRLGSRHESIKEAGASWDWESYNPHVTITYEPGDVDLSKVTPYRGEIKLGPEIFAELDEDWKTNVKES